MGILAKIEQDYPTVDISNQLSELHVRATMASTHIVENKENLIAALNNITELANKIDSVNFDVNEQRRQILEMQNTILYGIPPNNLWNSIDNIREELDSKVDKNDLNMLQQEFEFQRQQLELLAGKLDDLKSGSNGTGIDLETMARIQRIEEQIEALLNSPFSCGTQEVNISCNDFITAVLSGFTNMTVNFTSNEDRLEELYDTLNDLGDEVEDLRNEFNSLLQGVGSSLPFNIIRRFQEQVANTSEYLVKLGIKQQSDYDYFTSWISNIANDVNHLIKVSLSNSDEISQINRAIDYLNYTYWKLPNLNETLYHMHLQIEEIKKYYTSQVENNQHIIADLQDKVEAIIPTLSTLGIRQEVYSTELREEMAAIRSEFLDLPDSPRIKNFVNDLDEKIMNISLEVLHMETQQQHYNYQVGQLDSMRYDIESLQNMTRRLFNMTLNQSYSMVVNMSDFDEDWLNETLVPLVRRIDILESVVSAHQAMNFSRQIDALATMINTHTSSINNLMAQVNGTITLTNEQLDDLAHRLSILEPTQEVLQIRDDLNRLIRLERDHPLINISRDISLLDTRISVYETLLPPETLEAILKDIQILKEKLNSNSMLNDGEILIIQTQIRQLVAAAEKHTDDIEELRDITALLDDASTDHDTALAEIEIELDSLENAINTIITNGNIGDLGIPNEIQKLHDEDQKTRDMVHYLESQLDELKHQLRYYAACTHSADCRPGQLCSHHSECLWEAGSVVCAWEKLNCAKTCHRSGDCHMLKHVWKKEFKDQCRQDMTCKNV